MTERTAVLMDRWMGLLMNAWQVLCQSGRQSKTPGEGENHLDFRDSSLACRTPLKLISTSAWSPITRLYLLLMRPLYSTFLTYCTVKLQVI